MNDITHRETAAERTRWDHWQGRYYRSSRRHTRQARIAAVLIFVAIVGNLLVQLFARRV